MEFRFEERGLGSGLTNEHLRLEVAPELKHVESILSAQGASVSVADYNNDGHYDIFYTSARTGSHHSLYRNKGDGTFTDIAESAGIADLNRDGNNGISALWIDYDNDGWQDLFLVNVGCNRLYRNMQGKRFENVTPTAGEAGGKPDKHGFCASGRSALAFDFNRDGHLDIYVSNFNPKDWRRLHDGDHYVMFPSTVRDDSGPANYLLRNNGDGTFTEIAEEAGVANHRWSQSAGASDFNNDGWPDLFVANDFSGPDRIYLNDGGHRFTLMPEEMLIGMFPRSGMNGDIADVNEDGFMDIYNTKITRPWFTSGVNQLWLNQGGKSFLDKGRKKAAAACGWAWAARFADFANRGKKDIFVVNGVHSGRDRRSYWYSLGVMGSMGTTLLKNAKTWPEVGDRSISGHEKNCLFYSVDGGYTDVAEQAGVTDDWDGRGIAIIDVENRGLADVVIGNVGRRALLYRNIPSHGNNWLGLKLRMRRGNRLAIGARALLWYQTNDGSPRKQYWEVSAGNGFSSQSDERLRFGLGPGPVKLLSLDVIWPTGTQESFPVADLKLNSYNVVYAKE